MNITAVFIIFILIYNSVAISVSKKLWSDEFLSRSVFILLRQLESLKDYLIRGVENEQFKIR